VVYGAGGAVGGAVARAFAREGARSSSPVVPSQSSNALAKEITAAGGQADTAQVDALDKQAVDEHAATVAEKAGSIDVTFNAIGIDHIQGTPLRGLSPEDYSLPITTYTRTQFLTTTAAARHMVRRSSGVILTLSTTAARVTRGGRPGCLAESLRYAVQARSGVQRRHVGRGGRDHDAAASGGHVGAPALVHPVEHRLAGPAADPAVREIEVQATRIAGAQPHGGAARRSRSALRACGPPSARRSRPAARASLRAPAG